MRNAPPNDLARAKEILAKSRDAKDVRDVRFLRQMIDRAGSIEYASDFAWKLGAKAARTFRAKGDWMPQSRHRDFLVEMAAHVIERDR